MRFVIFVLSVLFGMAAPAAAQLSLSVGLPGLSIGVNVPFYPQLVPVPGYPVYYAPGLQANFFFYDGLYWVYQGDDWYASDWYDGPWGVVSPEAVPLFILRVPVRYYRSPPTYFRGWRSDAPPRWGDHWGNDWQQQRRGWDRWNRNAVPTAAPLPNYQRSYAAERYPRPEQQQALRERNYRYQPRDAVVRQHLQARPAVQGQQPQMQPQQQPQWQPQRAPQREPRGDVPQRRDSRDGRDGRDGREVNPAQQPPPERRLDRRPERAPEAPAPRAPAEQPPRQQAPQPHQPDAAPQQDRAPGRGQQRKPDRAEQDKPDRGRQDSGRGPDNGDERDHDRKK